MMGNDVLYVFLDIDGVLNSRRFWEHSGKHLPLGQVGAIDPLAVALLNKITVHETVRVVLSTSWRHQGVEVVRGYLRQQGFYGHIVGATPTIFNAPRYQEISEWLAQLSRTYPYMSLSSRPWKRFAVIDDIFDAGALDANLTPPRYFTRCRGKFFQTNFIDGLTEETVNAVLEWFEL